MADVRTPTPDEVREAVATLMAAWAPGIVAARVAHASAPAGADGQDPDEVCGCAGEDPDTGESLGCNCHDSCGCPLCAHDRHRATRICSVRDCRQLARLQVRAWAAHPNDTVVRSGDDGDPNRDERGMVRLGASAQTHTVMRACGTAHARTLIDEDLAYRARFAADCVLGAELTRYEVERWEYLPDGVDLAGLVGDEAGWVLLAARDGLRYAARLADEAVRAVYQGEVGDYRLTALPETLALALDRLTRIGPLVELARHPALREDE